MEINGYGLELQEAIDKLMFHGMHGMKLDAKPDQKPFDLDHDLDDFDYESEYAESDSELDESNQDWKRILSYYLYIQYNTFVI